VVSGEGGQRWTPAMIPEVSGKRRGYDGLQRGVGNSGAWSSLRFASSRGGERWPEGSDQRRASAMVGDVGSLRFWTEEDHEDVH
jgi:hypothetical protein